MDYAVQYINLISKEYTILQQTTRFKVYFILQSKGAFAYLMIEIKWCVKLLRSYPPTAEQFQLLRHNHVVAV